MGVEILNKDSFDSKIVEGRETALVDFYADWCMPCKIFGPVLESLSEDLKGKVNCYKVNVDNDGEVASRFGVMSIPTVILFKDGSKVDSFTGSLPKEKVKSFIDKGLGGK